MLSESIVLEESASEVLSESESDDDSFQKKRKAPKKVKNQKKSVTGKNSSQKDDESLHGLVLASLSLDELKELCRKHFMPVSGTKATLVERLTKVVSLEEIKSQKASAQKRGKKVKSIAGCSDAAYALTDSTEARKVLQKHVKTLAKLVNADWHDGEEEQSDELREYLKTCNNHLLSVAELMDAAAKLQTRDDAVVQFERCLELLLVVEDSYVDMCSVPMRSVVSEFCEGAYNDFNEPMMDLEIDTYKFKDRKNAMQHLWQRLIATAASVAFVPDELLCSMIKAAHDYKVKFLEQATSQLPADPSAPAKKYGWQEKRPPPPTKTTARVAGYERVAALTATKTKWQHLPCVYIEHKQRHAVDRRFSGGGRRRGCAIS